MVITQKTDTSKPNYTRPEAVEASADLQLIDDLLAGSRRMWKVAREREYIRKWAEEDNNVYRIRSRSEVLYEGFSRVLSASVGMLFAKPPKMEWNESEGRIKPHWDDLDTSGTAGHVFVKRFADMAVRDGLALLLVDHAAPPINPDTGDPVVVTAENEGPLGLRPKWAAYSRSTILSWLTDRVNNRTEVTQVVLHEPTQMKDGAYGTKTAHMFRVIAMDEGQASWALWRMQEGAGGEDEFVVEASGVFRNVSGEIKDRLPIAVAYTGRKRGEMVADPPLMAVAWMNLSHWRTATNLAFYLDLSCFPQPAVSGLVKQAGADGTPVAGKLRLGPVVVVELAMDGKFEWVELEGKSIEANERAVAAKERRIGQLGMSFMSPDSRQAETAEAKRLDATAENASLATAAQGIDDAVNMALEHHAWYMGIPKAEAPVFEVNRDFESTAMDADTMRAYALAVKSAGLPVRLLLEAWQHGGRIGPDADLDALEMEMMAGESAARDREAEERSLLENEMDDAA